MPRGDKEHTQIYFDALSDPTSKHRRGDFILLIEVIASLTRIRTEKDITQHQLAKMSGIAQPTIARLESGKSNPTLAQLIKIAGAMGCKVKIE